MNPNIGNKIKQLREEHQLSLAELAANASIYPMQLEKIESGEIQPTMAIMVRISRALGTRLGTILDGEEQRVDLGVAGGERFVNVFSCGLFTDVSQKTPTVLKNNFGKLAYYFGGLGELPNFRKMHITIRSEEVDYDGTSLIFFVFNGRTAGKMRFAYSAEIDDGLLDVIVVKGDGPIGTLRALFHFIRQNAGLRRLDPGDYPEGVLHFKSRDFVVDSPMRRNEVTDIDGQPGPRFPVRITCEAGALRVIRPAHHRKD